MLICIVFSGCKGDVPEPTPQAPPPPPSFPVTVYVNDMSFEVLGKPTKLVSLSPDITEALDDIGAASFLAGISDNCAALTGASAQNTCGTSLIPDTDLIKQIAPDFVLTSAPLFDAAREELTQSGIKIISLPRPDSIDKILERSKALFLICYGETAGNEQAKEFAKTFQAKLDNIIKPAAAYSAIADPKSVVYLAYPDFTMATGDTFEGELLEKMGLSNLGASGSEWQFPEEEAAALLPDVIFYDSTLDPSVIVQSETYSNSPAVLKKKLVPIDFRAVQRENLAMLDELSKIVLACYPDAYAGG